MSEKPKSQTPRFSGWASYVYNPWVSESRLLKSSRVSSTAADDFSGVGDSAQVIQWNNAAAAGGSPRLRIFAGPWCRVLTDDVDRTRRGNFWDLVRGASAIDWLLMFDGGTERSVKLPADWGHGFDNCWVGVKLTGPASASDQLDALRSIPAHRRFVVAAPLVQDLGDLSLHGIHWFISQLTCERATEPDSVISLKLQCMAYGVPFWLEEDQTAAYHLEALDHFAFHEEPAA